MNILRQFKTLQWILRQPLNKGKALQTLRRWLYWHIGSRLVPGPVMVKYVDNITYLTSPGMTGATGNIYAGLIEFEEMSFMMHFLNKSDLMVDVGANVGMFSLLAAGVSGAEVIAFEPVPTTFKILEDNVRLNRLEERICLLNMGVGDSCGTIRLTDDSDQTNRVVSNGEKCDGSVVSKAVSLDVELGRAPSFIKIDVEGYELAVLRGAAEIVKSPELKAMIVECKDYGNRYGFEEDELFNTIYSAGFVPISYSPFLREIEVLDSATVQKGGNCLFVRDPVDARKRTTSALPFRVAGQEV